MARLRGELVEHRRKVEALRKAVEEQRQFAAELVGGALSTQRLSTQSSHDRTQGGNGAAPGLADPRATEEASNWHRHIKGCT